MNEIKTYADVNVKLYFRVRANNVPITFTFVDSDGEPYSFVYDEFQFILKDYAGAKKNRLLLGLGSGLSLNANVLTLDGLTEDNVNIKAGKYYWQLYKNDYGRPWFAGEAEGIEGPAPYVDPDTTITINEGGTNITVTIAEGSISGGSGVEHWRGAHDLSGNAYPSSGGSGTAGAIQGGDEWYVSVVGILDLPGQPDTPLELGTLIKALVDNPGQIASNWKVTQG